jgi:hypothetical protein
MQKRENSFFLWSHHGKVFNDIDFRGKIKRLKIVFKQIRDKQGRNY